MLLCCKCYIHLCRVHICEHSDAGSHYQTPPSCSTGRRYFSATQTKTGLETLSWIRNASFWSITAKWKLPYKFIICKSLTKWLNMCVTNRKTVLELMWPSDFTKRLHSPAQPWSSFSRWFFLLHKWHKRAWFMWPGFTTKTFWYQWS